MTNQISEYLNNYIMYMPEVYLGISIILLISYGVIYSKIGGKIGELKQITNLSILTLILTIYLEYSIELGEVQELSTRMNMLGLDKITQLVKIIIMISSIIVLIMSLEVYKNRLEKIEDYEYTQLILLSTLGMLLLVSSRDLIIMYLSIETLSLSLYILAAIRKSGQLSTEAGLKYFVLGALSSGLLLFGCALLYITTGMINYIDISNYININNEASLIGIEVGIIFIIFAILFKLAAAPFHMWAPDVYEGSPTIVTTYFATVPKISIFILLINLIYGPFLFLFSTIIKPLIIICGLLSIIIGSLGALNQTKFKRLLAYSAIGHIGFILLGLIPATINSIQASFIYIILYIIMSFNSFTFIMTFYYKYLSSTSITFSGSHFLSQLNGLSRNEPILAATLTISLFSIAGIPPLAGFMSKYLILLTLIDNHYYIIALIAVIFSVIACFYYIRIIQFMFFKPSSLFSIKILADIAYRKVNPYSYSYIPLSSALILGSTSFFILTFLLFPNPLFIITFDVINHSFI